MVKAIIGALVQNSDTVPLRKKYIMVLDGLLHIANKSFQKIQKLYQTIDAISGETLIGLCANMQIERYAPVFMFKG